MQRRLEPQELMDNPHQAAAYAQADFSEPNTRFLEAYAIRFPEGPQAHEGETAHALDLGCGPADITRRFARIHPHCHVLGLDGAKDMLRFGRKALARDPVNGRVELLCGCLPDAQLPRRAYDIILSNSLLHHLPDPRVLWEAVRAYGRPGAQVLIMDLFRPESLETARRIVNEYVAGEAEVLCTDFYNSLLAAFLPEEVTAQLEQAGLGSLRVETLSDRHLMVSGYRR